MFKNVSNVSLVVIIKFKLSEVVPAYMNLIGTTGKPAAGKTAAAKEISNALDCPMVEMGDVVTERTASYLDIAPDEITSDQKGNAATELREEYGPTVFAEATVEKAQEFNSEYCVISGIRTPEEISVFDSEGVFTLVLVTAPFDVRYERFTSRGREDEESFSKEDFESRNERELGWGLDKVLSEELYDVTIENTGGLDELQERITDFIQEV